MFMGQTQSVPVDCAWGLAKTRTSESEAQKESFRLNNFLGHLNNMAVGGKGVEIVIIFM